MNKKRITTLWRKNVSYWRQWSTLGLLLGLLFLAFSLSPSLVPRPLMLQGVASGIALTMGYALGIAIMSLWRFLELPELRDKLLRFAQYIAGGVVALTVIHFYSNATLWQNAVRSLMEMDPTDGVALVRVTIVAVVLWLALVYLATGIKRLYVIAAKKVHQYVPRRVSFVAGGVVLTIGLIFIVNGLLIQNAISAIDNMYAKVDQAIPDNVTAPTLTTRSGSPDSLVEWNDLGSEGKYFVTGGPTTKQIRTVTGKPASEPVRVYVGLSSADSSQAQAELALAELKRTNAFSKNKLVIATPTGTGWIDEGAVDSFEYLYGGDTAIVGVQYSYLSSPVTLILDPNRARISAKAVFSTIYNYWSDLPEDTRPELFIYGLSLGSLGSESSSNIYSMLSDPIAGALWTGPPFANDFWPEVRRNRNPDSPAFRPALDDGELVRVLDAGVDKREYAPWGPLKIVYLLHPSDAIVFFSFDLWYKEPDWLKGQRGTDVSPYLTWYPLVTMWQIGLDMLVTTNVPYGHGHNYAPNDYLRAWLELDEQVNWSEAEIERISQALGSGGLSRQ